METAYSAIRGARDPQLYKIASNVEGLKERARAIGVDEELLKPRESLFSKALNFIDKPKQMVLGALDSTFLRKDISDIGLLGAVDRGLEERANVFDVLRRETDLSPVSRGVLGFAGEVLLDPLNLLTFGAGGAAKAGGKALTKQGVSKFDELTTALGGAEDFLGASTRADDAFMHMGRMLDAKKDIAIAKKLGDSAQDLVASARHDDAYKSLRELAPDLDISDLDDVFEKPSIKSSLTLPFLGHIKDSKKDFSSNVEFVKGLGKEDSSLMRSIFRGAGEVIKPAKLWEDSFQIPAPVVDSFNLAKGKVSKTIRDAREGIKHSIKTGEAGLTKKTLGAIDGFAQKLGDSAARTWSQGAILGARGERARVDYLNKQAAAPAIGFNEARRITGLTLEELVDEKTIQAHRRLGAIIDSGTSDFFNMKVKELDDAVKLDGNFISQAGADKVKGKILDEINELLRNPEADITEIKTWLAGGHARLEDVFIGKLKSALDSGELSPGEGSLIRETMAHFTRLRDKELAHGIDSGFIDAYIPHVFTNVDTEKIRRTTSRNLNGVEAGFTESRKYKDVAEAFTTGRLEADTNISALIQKRTAASYKAIAQKEYIKRVALEKALPGSVYK